MSASREKKQRQGAGTSEKATQVKNEQAAYKRKARTYTIIGVVIVVLVAALLIVTSNPVMGGKTAATVGGEKLSVAELGYYYYKARYPYVAYGLLDNTKSDADQKFGEQTYRDFFLESALTNAQDITAIYNAAIEAGYKDSDVADDLSTSLENAKATAASSGVAFKSYLKGMYGAYMTPSIFKDIMTKSLVANKYYSDKYDETLDATTEADILAYYEEHADELDEITYSYLQFKGETVSTKDADGKERTEDEIKKLEEEALAAAKVQAEEALAAYNAGETTIAELIEQFKPTTSSDHRVSQGVESLSSLYSEELLKLGEDEAALVETEDSGYYVVIFHSKGRNETLSANVRHILFKADHTVGADNKITAPGEKLMTETETEAKAVLDEFLAGAQTAEAFAELANKYSDDVGSNTTGGLYEQVVENYFVSELNDWLFGEEKPEVGDTAVIRHEGDAAASNPYWGTHIIYLEGWDMAFWQIDARDALVSELMETLRTDLAKNYEPVLAAGAESLGK